MKEESKQLECESSARGTEGRANLNQVARKLYLARTRVTHDSIRSSTKQQRRHMLHDARSFVTLGYPYGVH